MARSVLNSLYRAFEDDMPQDFFRTDLESSVTSTETEILKIARAVVPNAELKRIGPMGAANPSWSCWIITATNFERDRIKDDSEIIAKLWKAASDAGFPPDSFTVQSHESVKRDYKGSWFYAMR